MRSKSFNLGEDQGSRGTGEAYTISDGHTSDGTYLSSFSNGNVDMPQTEDRKGPTESEVDNEVIITRNDAILGTREDPLQTWRLGLTTLLIFVWLCLGFYQTLIGPTMTDLRNRLGTNYEEISFASSGRDIGVLIGSLFGGFLNERFYKYSLAMIGIGTLVPGGITTAIPHLPNVGLLFTFFCINGIMEGITNSGGNTMILHLWGEQSGSPMSAMHGGFGLAAIVVPLFVKPFLGTFEDDDESTTTAPPVSTVPYGTVEPLKESHIEVPYAIVGLICIIGSLVVFFIFFKGPPRELFHHKPSKSFKEMANPVICGYGNSCYAIVMFIFLFLYFFQTIGMSRAYGNYIFSYSKEGLHFSDSDASLINTVYWIGFTFGRFGGAVVARFVRTQVLIGSYLAGSAVIVIVLHFLGRDEAVALWICTPIQGTFNGIMYPLGMAWGNLYLHMNSVAVIVPLVGASAGGTSYAYLIGYLFDKDPHNWTLVLVSWCAIFITLYIIMQTVATVWNRKIQLSLEQEQLENERDYVEHQKENYGFELKPTENECL